MATPRIWLFVSALSLASISACGQKGPLYLPEDTPPPAQTSQPCRTAACEEIQNQEKEDAKDETAVTTEENTE